LESVQLETLHTKCEKGHDRQENFFPRNSFTNCPRNVKVKKVIFFELLYEKVNHGLFSKTKNIEQRRSCRKVVNHF